MAKQAGDRAQDHSGLILQRDEQAEILGAAFDHLEAFFRAADVASKLTEVADDTIGKLLPLLRDLLQARDGAAHVLQPAFGELIEYCDRGNRADLLGALISLGKKPRAAFDKLQSVKRRAAEAYGRLPASKAAFASSSSPCGPTHSVPPELSQARHSMDFRSVHWYGTDYFFTDLQGRCLRELWAAWKNGTPEISGKQILAQAETDQPRLDKVFRSVNRGRTQAHPAWGVMIVKGSGRGTYRLQMPSDEDTRQCPPERHEA